MGKSTISMAIFNSFLYVYRRVNILTLGLDTLDDSSWLDWLWRTAILCPGNGGGENHQKWHPHDVHVHVYIQYIYIYLHIKRERESFWCLIPYNYHEENRLYISQELLVELSVIVCITCTHTHTYICTHIHAMFISSSPLLMARNL